MSSVKIVILLMLNAALCISSADIFSKTRVKLPEEDMHTCQMVRYYGYPCESHEVTTDDGYILVMHRIPHGMKSNTTGKTVVFLQHGLVDSSFTWVANPPHMSLGFLLADRGYDVWLGNSRGNTYSSRHVVLRLDSEAFWDFSFDEMAKYDLPASIGYVCKSTENKQVYYIGHSQGTAIGFAGFSDHKLAAKIKLFIALAPITAVDHIKGILKIMSMGSFMVKVILYKLGTKNFLPSSFVTKYFAKIVCPKHAQLQKLCADVLFLLCGYDMANLDTDRLPIYVSHTPAGTSVKDILHFNQMIHTGKFKMYDHGWNGNMHRYMQPVPPEYYIGDMKVPTALFTGTNDWLSTPQDVAVHLRHHLPNQVYDQNDDNWNHMDFVWGKHAKTVVYDNIFKLLEGKTPAPRPKKTRNGITK